MRKFLIILFLIVIAFLVNAHDLPLEEKSVEEIEKHLLSEIGELGIRQTLSQLQSYFDAGKLSSNDCHSIAHRLGQKAEEVYRKSTAAVKATHVCRSGFIHGIFENLTSEEKESKNFISSICDKSFGMTEADSLQCFHGLGHGLMAYDYNLEIALTSCELLDQKVFRETCASGTYMEAFIPGLYLVQPADNSFSTPFEFCNQNKFKETCYLYSGLSILKRTGNNYFDSVAYCDNAGEFKSLCLRGMGVIITRDSDYSPENVIARCGTNLGFENCLLGAASEYGLSLEIAEGIKFCSQTGLLVLGCYSELINAFSKHI